LKSGLFEQVTIPLLHSRDGPYASSADLEGSIDQFADDRRTQPILLEDDDVPIAQLLECHAVGAREERLVWRRQDRLRVAAGPIVVRPYVGGSVTSGTETRFVF